jgi:hypothetical protein
VLNQRGYCETSQFRLIIEWELCLYKVKKTKKITILAHHQTVKVIFWNNKTVNRGYCFQGL